jgi:hypothetical protein
MGMAAGSVRKLFGIASIAFRLAFSTINDAPGVKPDRQIAAAAHEEVRNAITFGRAGA